MFGSSVRSREHVAAYSLKVLIKSEVFNVIDCFGIYICRTEKKFSLYRKNGRIFFRRVFLRAQNK